MKDLIYLSFSFIYFFGLYLYEKLKNNKNIIYKPSKDQYVPIKEDINEDWGPIIIIQR